MKSDKQRETLNKGQFPFPGTVRWDREPDARLTPSRLITDPELGSARTQPLPGRSRPR